MGIVCSSGDVRFNITRWKFLTAQPGWLMRVTDIYRIDGFAPRQKDHLS
jgi:hypothetical protein